jgi:hypothetical protein
MRRSVATIFPCQHGFLQARKQKFLANHFLPAQDPKHDFRIML